MFYNRKKDMISKIVDALAPVVVALAMLLIASILAFLVAAFICATKLLYNEVMSSAVVSVSSFV